MNFTLDPTILSAGLGAVVALMIAFFGWLNHKFNLIESTARSIEEHTSDALDEHEKQDQRRHEENLYRFEKISVALAKLGSTNGTASH